jgi:formylmethanofuran dehydrogenase subunit E
MQLISTRDPRQMIVLIENDRCIADAIQIVTGTRIGRRSAKLVDLGKMAATFLNGATGLAYRVNVKSFNLSGRHGQEACRIVLSLPDAELLSWQQVRVVLKPTELPGKPLRTVLCARCGEKVFDGKDVEGRAGPLCRSCAGGPYYAESAAESE